MMYSVVLSEQADADLREIFEYIAFTLLSGENAIGQLARLEDAIAELDHVPKRFQLYDREPWHSRGLRCMPVDHYRIFYIPSDEKFSVTVIRVMYDGRNADIQLKNNMID